MWAGSVCLKKMGKMGEKQTKGTKQLKGSGDSVQMHQASQHTVGSYRGFSVGKMLIAQVSGPEFKVQHPPKSQMLQCACLQSYSWGREDRRTPGTHGSRQSVSSRFSERLRPRAGGKHLRRTLVSPSSLCLQTCG